MGWTPAAVESELIAAFRAIPDCAVFSVGAQSSDPGFRTADGTYRARRNALTDVLNWARLLEADRDARKYLWAWARCKATKDSFADLCRTMGWQKSEAERGRRRGAQSLASILNSATQGAPSSTKKSLDFDKGGIGRFPDIAAPPGS